MDAAQTDKERIAALENALQSLLVTASATSRKATMYALLVYREDYDDAHRLLGREPPPHPWDQ